MPDPEEAPEAEAPPAGLSRAAWLAGPVAGAAGAAVALGFGELVEGASDSIPSLVIAVGEVVTDYTPGDVVAFTIDNLGDSQKGALTTGIVVLSLAICGLLGRAAVRGRRAVAVGGFALFGLVGGWAAARNPLSPAVASWAVALAATALGAATTLFLVSRATAPRRAVVEAESVDADGGGRERVGTRRSFFGYAGGAAVTALGLVGIGRSLRGESAAEIARETYALPSRTPSAAADDGGPSDAASDPQATVEATAPPQDPSTPTQPTDDAGQAAPGTSQPSGDRQQVSGDEAVADPAGTQAAEQPAETAPDAAPTTTRPGDQPEQAATTSTQPADQQPEPTTQPETEEPEPTTQPEAEEPAPTTTQPEAEEPAPTTTEPEPEEPATTTTEPPRNLSVSDQVARLDTLDEVAGISPYITPKGEFYRIDTALTVPQVDPADWRLRITGMVDNPLELTFDDILSMELSDHVITLACVSNPVGGDLVDNAVWTGVPLAVLLERAGAQRAANQVVGRSVDDFTAGFPTGVVHDGRNAILAIGMNDELLPTRHGFPARLVVAGLYGYVSAVKWLDEIHLTTWDGFDGYWVPRGWSKRGPMKTQSRIDVPRRGARLKAGEATPVAGIAWAPTRGISRVETKIGDEAWTPCRLGQALGDESWVQWHREWTPPTSGSYEIRVRATDGKGTTQGSLNIPSKPNGAEGHHTITVSAQR